VVVQPAQIQQQEIILPPSDDEPQTNTNRILGRALVEEIDDLDDDSPEVPSYTPSKPVAKLPVKPGPPAAAKGKAEPAPRAPRKAAAKPSSGAKQPASKAPRSTSSGRGRSSPKPPPPPEKIVVPPPKPIPAPKPFDDDDFGAGLET
jgi:hypothetical protein